jgi:hypothetical protein
MEEEKLIAMRPIRLRRVFSEKIVGKDLFKSLTAFVQTLIYLSASLNFFVFHSTTKASKLVVSTISALTLLPSRSHLPISHTPSSPNASRTNLKLVA